MLYRTVIAVAAFAIAAPAAGAIEHFVNWESPHVNGLDLTPNGARLLAVNTDDHRLEVFEVSGTSLVHAGSVPVGLEPVSVRARTSTEAWVVNHVSDSISVVDLDALNVIATISTGDEPTDVVFAGAPLRAFVSVSQLNQVRVFDPNDLAAPAVILDIDGEDPRALATDGARVYAAVFESGNGTTILGEAVVSSNVNPYPGNANPPPNDGAGFEPPITAATPPGVSHIVKKQAGGTWQDDNGGDWSAAVTWDLHDHDVAVINVATLATSYVSGLMNLNMNVTVTPDGDVVVIGTEAMNHIRFEPNLNGRFVRVHAASFAPPTGTPSIVDLNPHLDYTTPSVGAGQREMSLADPRGIDWSADGTGYIAGFGSNNVAVVDASLNRLDHVDVGAGPTSVRVNDAADVVYVLNKLDGSLSVIARGSLAVLGTVDFFDGTPDVIRLGRPHLYDAHATSGLGITSCASCHADGRMDQLAWDLGDPSGSGKPLPNALCNLGLGGCESEWHPMKGPMTTQTLVGILETGVLHWRGDRDNFAEFNGAFVSLLGKDAQLTTTEMAQFEAFVGTITYPPNPFQGLDGSLPTSLQGGNAVIGENDFQNAGLDGVQCATCHAFPTGTNGTLTSGPLLLETQSIKIPQLRNLYEKTGFDDEFGTNARGFGFLHDGSIHTLMEFFQFPGFSFSGDQQRRDVVAFMLAFGADTHASVGVQATIGGAGPDATALRDALIARADAGDTALIARGVVNGEPRGYRYTGADTFQSDRAAETATLTELDAASLDDAITYMLVPLVDGADPNALAVRLSLDRDEDSFLDGDETDACTDPADPSSFPGDGQPTICDCPADLDGNGDIGFTDLLIILNDWGPCVGCVSDLDGNGDVGFADLLVVLGAWGACA